jgi:hypothetical protein
MDPVSLIVGALAAGTATGFTETATTAVKDAYLGLKKVVAARFSGKPEAQIILAQHEAKPDVWQAPLAEALLESGASTDPVVVKAAQRLMALLDDRGSRSGKYTVDLRGAQGVQVGEGGHQFNVFSTPPTKQ